ncbi:Glutamyl-tRNA amidotransferase B subunit [Desarmillaria tabescens]|uniref:Glutamyl-tRNA(Gln) amidotransferase subunit B, mitochondrial n=1 Tax=Armillaria tabescens TaxID=1929756 RepID=A0AA39TVS3_ARMTA|nr:Glutamyl-tRNA amidotransferase B subunit [Desarmillaria tabescens]KAK0461085.1 Glutamyl-tRNA amidotransferase B subunit [Desarmillaria tabescens]
MSRLLLDGWHVVLGIETHAQIKSRQKLFSSASTSLLTHPANTTFNVVDAAFPGTLPKLNPKCLLLALRASLALNCDIQRRSSFDRKHYFYSDLPSGYQITQHYAPIATDGYLTLPTLGRKVRIKQIQMEQDTAKSIFDPRTQTSLIDLNRAGTGLLEIVTEPDLQSPDEAAEYVRALQATLRAVGASDGNMDTGSMRCDVNVSIHRPGEPFGTRCEIKNLNSVKFMVAAINCEIVRQKTLLMSSCTVPQETRGFDHYRWDTYKLRSKEDAPEYRYMPDPNLGILHVSEAQIQEMKDNLPALPDALRKRLVDTYEPFGVTQIDVDVLMGLDTGRDIGYDSENNISLDETSHQDTDISAVAYFEAVCADKNRDPKNVINWILHSLQGQLSMLDKTFTSKHITPRQLGELIDLVASNSVTRPSGKLLLRHMLTDPSITPETSVRQLAVKLNFMSMSSSSGDDLQFVCTRAVEALPDEVAALRAGHHNVINKIVGWVMKETRGRADAKTVRETVLNLVKT